MLKGSARSIPNFDIYHALKKCENTLIQFGGHKHAAGMVLKPEKFQEFKTAINNFADEFITDDMLMREICIDAVVDINEIAGHISEYWKILKNFEPYGPGNQEPVFLSANVPISDVRIFGNNHLKFKIKVNGLTIDAIGYGLSKFYPEILGRDRASIVFSFDEGLWNGQSVIQFKIKDLK